MGVDCICNALTAKCEGLLKIGYNSFVKEPFVPILLPQRRGEVQRAFCFLLSGRDHPSKACGDMRITAWAKMYIVSTTFIRKEKSCYLTHTETYQSTG